VSIGGRDGVEDGASLVLVEVGVSPDVLVEAVAPSALKDRAGSGSDGELEEGGDAEAMEGERRHDGRTGATGGGERDWERLEDFLDLKLGNKMLVVTKLEWREYTGDRKNRRQECRAIRTPKRKWNKAPNSTRISMKKKEAPRADLRPIEEYHKTRLDM
jgi:hypothetical protein